MITSRNRSLTLLQWKGEGIFDSFNKPPPVLGLFSFPQPTLPGGDIPYHHLIKITVNNDNFIVAIDVSSVAVSGK